MTKYRDPTDPPPDPDAIATCCPLCRGELVTRWFGISAHGRRQRAARAFPLRVCTKCHVAVQVRRLPIRRALHATRRAARAAAAKENDAIEADRERRPF